MSPKSGVIHLGNLGSQEPDGDKKNVSKRHALTSRAFFNSHILYSNVLLKRPDGNDVGYCVGRPSVVWLKIFSRCHRKYLIWLPF